MEVRLTPELERIIHEKVASGLYESADDAVREAVRLLIRRDQEHQARLEALRQGVREAIEQLDRGQGIFADDDFFESIKRDARALLQQRKSA